MSNFLLDFDEFVFLEKTGKEPYSFDKDFFQYEYKFIDTISTEMIFYISFSLLDKTLCVTLKNNNRVLMKILEKNIFKIDFDEELITFYVNDKNKTVSFNYMKFSLNIETTLFSDC